MSPSVENFIGGVSVDAASGRTLPLVNPATGEELGSSPDSGAEDVARAVDAARGAFAEWSSTTPGERSAALLAIADALEGDVDELARLEATSAGHPLQSFIDD